MFCRYCKKDVETPCQLPTDAMMRCEIATPDVPNNIAVGLPVSPVQEPRQVSGNAPLMAEAYNGYPVVSQPSYPTTVTHITGPVVQPKFNFDDNVLALLKILADDSEEIERLWERAKAASEEYDIVLKPTLTKKQ